MDNLNVARLIIICFNWRFFSTLQNNFHISPGGDRGINEYTAARGIAAVDGHFLEMTLYCLCDKW